MMVDEREIGESGRCERVKFQQQLLSRAHGRALINTTSFQHWKKNQPSLDLFGHGEAQDLHNTFYPIHAIHRVLLDSKETDRSRPIFCL